MSQIEQVTHDPDWQEPYGLSLGIKANGFVFVSGQIGNDENDELVGPDFASQARQVFKNITTVMEAAGGSLSDIVKLTIMVKEISAAREMKPIIDEFFAKPYPATTLFQVVSLGHTEALLEIEAIAVAR